MQDVVDDLLLGKLEIARVADAQPKPPEFSAAQLRDDVLEAVVSGASAAELELYASRLQIQLVVRDQDLGRRDAIEMRERRDRKPALVHVTLRQHETDLCAVRLPARDQAAEARFRLKAQIQHGREPF